MTSAPYRLPIESIYLRGAEHQTLQARLTSGIVQAILEQSVRPGTRLPSSRALAEALGLSRMTVTLVYQELVSQGYIEALPRLGMAVAKSVPSRALTPCDASEAAADQRVDWDAWLTGIAPRKRVIRKPEDWRSLRWPFIYGQADPRLFDHAAWRECARRALSAREFAGLADDLLAQDDPMLIEHIRSHTLPRRGIIARPEEVLITMGAQHGLYMAIDLLARPDRPAAIEEPGYPDFAETLRRAGAPIRLLSVDADGLDPDAIPAGTRLVIATPSHHVPTGATMSLERRATLLARASAEDFLIVEDDYDFEMSYLAPPMPALKSMDRDERVIYLGSFSKSLFPGLRIGYMVGPADLIAAARSARAVMLRHAPPHPQRITAWFLALGHYDTHITRLREALKARRAVLTRALEGTPLTVAGADAVGGSALWVAAPVGTDSERLAAAAAACGVLIEPGAVFFEEPPVPCRYFRLGYSSIAAEDIPEGVAQLVAGLRLMDHARMPRD